MHSVIAELQSIVTADDFDLLRACLAVARLDDEELDVPAYLREVERMTEEIQMKSEEGSSEQARLEAIDSYLFRENGFHGSRHEYYHRANSHIHRVIDDREGLPITLSVLYMELGARLGLKIEGVGLPGHFVVRFQPSDGEPQLIDVFESGKRLTSEDAAAIVEDYSLESLTDEHLQAATDKQILQRILHNLLNVAEQQQDTQSLRRYLEALVAIEPDSVQFRGMRAIARFQTGRQAAAIADLDWFLEHQPPGVDLDRIREMRAAFSGQ
jgi:regulator of sirC expression with transglutaminase-like and TPR domain